MEKKVYVKPNLRILSIAEDMVMVNVASTEADDTFEEGVKRGFLEVDRENLSFLHFS